MDRQNKNASCPRSLRERRPKLGADTFFIPSEHGVWLRNNAGSFTINGQGAYELVERLAPYLTGEHTVADLVEGLDEKTAAFVCNVIAMLGDNGFVRDISTWTHQSLPEDLTRVYQGQIDFIDHHVGSGTALFAATQRRCNVLVACGTRFRLPVVGALLESGFANLRVLGEGAHDDRHDDRCDDGPPHAAVQEVVNHFVRRGARPEVTYHDTRQTRALMAQTHPDHLTYVVCDDPSLSDALCADLYGPGGHDTHANTVVISLQAWQDGIAIGPFARRGQGACHLCANLRAPRKMGAIPEASAGYPAVAIAANIIAFEAFRHAVIAITGQEDALLLQCKLRQHQCWIRHTDLETTTCEILPHPLCRFAHPDCAHPNDAGPSDTWISAWRKRVAPTRDGASEPALEKTRFSTPNETTSAALALAERFAVPISGILGSIACPALYPVPFATAQMALPLPSEPATRILLRACHLTAMAAQTEVAFAGLLHYAWDVRRCLGTPLPALEVTENGLDASSFRRVSPGAPAEPLGLVYGQSLAEVVTRGICQALTTAIAREEIAAFGQRATHPAWPAQLDIYRQALGSHASDARLVADTYAGIPVAAVRAGDSTLLGAGVDLSGDVALEVAARNAVTRFAPLATSNPQTDLPVVHCTSTGKETLGEDAPWPQAMEALLRQLNRARIQVFVVPLCYEQVLFDEVPTLAAVVLTEGRRGGGTHAA